MLADFLRMELRRVNPTLIPSLHRAAGQRHEHHGDIVEAIRYAQAAGDWHYAVRLLAENHLTLILDGRMAAIRDLLGALPQQASIADAELALVAATADAAEGLYDESAAHIAAAERIACTLPDDRRRPVELGLAANRLWLARLRGDVVGASGAFRSTELSLTTQPPARRNAQQPSSRHRAGQSRHRGGVVAVLGRWPPPSRAGTRARAPDQAAVPGDGVPRPPRARGRAQRIVGGRRTPVRRAGGLDRRGPPLEHRCRGRDRARGGGADARVAGPLHGRSAMAGPRAAGAGRRSGPATEVPLHTSRALVFLGQSRMQDAMAALRAAEEAGPVLPGEHASTRDLRGRVLRAQLQAGENAAVRSALADMPPAERNAAETRLAAAALELAEGLPVREMLERHRGHRTAHATLVATILDILGGGSPEPEVQALREPLSHAELRVVRYLPSNLKATEIASGLCVSPNTVRTHLRHIYAKLDAHTRSEAVTRARRLGLLGPACLSARR
jgi:LuxR family maltose regulon positive regulatory protein